MELPCFALLGDHELAADPRFRELCTLNDEMLGAYRSAKFGKDRALARKCLEISRGIGLPLEGLYGEYFERIGELKRTPLGKDWDPVFAPQQK